jgi:hypothetical protein
MGNSCNETTSNSICNPTGLIGSCPSVSTVNISIYNLNVDAQTLDSANFNVLTLMGGPNTTPRKNDSVLVLDTKCGELQFLGSYSSINKPTTFCGRLVMSGKTGDTSNPENTGYFTLNTTGTASTINIMPGDINTDTSIQAIMSLVWDDSSNCGHWIIYLYASISTCEPNYGAISSSAWSYQAHTFDSKHLYSPIPTKYWLDGLTNTVINAMQEFIIALYKNILGNESNSKSTANIEASLIQCLEQRLQILTDLEADKLKGGWVNQDNRRIDCCKSVLYLANSELVCDALTNDVITKTKTNVVMPFSSYINGGNVFTSNLQQVLSNNQLDALYKFALYQGSTINIVMGNCNRQSSKLQALSTHITKNSTIPVQIFFNIKNGYDNYIADNIETLKTLSNNIDIMNTSVKFQLQASRLGLPIDTRSILDSNGISSDLNCPCQFGTVAKIDSTSSLPCWLKANGSTKLHECINYLFHNRDFMKQIGVRFQSSNTAKSDLNGLFQQNNKGSGVWYDHVSGHHETTSISAPNPLYIAGDIHTSGYFSGGLLQPPVTWHTYHFAYISNNNEPRKDDHAHHSKFQSTFLKTGVLPPWPAFAYIYQNCSDTTWSIYQSFIDTWDDINDALFVYTGGKEGYTTEYTGSPYETFRLPLYNIMNDTSIIGAPAIISDCDEYAKPKCPTYFLGSVYNSNSSNMACYHIDKQCDSQASLYCRSPPWAQWLWSVAYKEDAMLNKIPIKSMYSGDPWDSLECPPDNQWYYKSPETSMISNNKHVLLPSAPNSQTGSFETSYTSEWTSVNMSFMCWLANCVKARTQELCFTRYIIDRAVRILPSMISSGNLNTSLGTYNLPELSSRATAAAEQSVSTDFKITKFIMTFGDPTDASYKISQKPWFYPMESDISDQLDSANYVSDISFINDPRKVYTDKSDNTYDSNDFQSKYIYWSLSGCENISCDNDTTPNGFHCHESSSSSYINRGSKHGGKRGSWEWLHKNKSYN